jgi:hypothetical protein
VNGPLPTIIVVQLISMVMTLTIAVDWRLFMSFYEALVVIGPIAAVFFAYHLGAKKESEREHRMIRSHFDALGMEIHRCADLAAIYLEQGIRAPLYRLPTSAYEQSMPVLKNTGIVSGGDAQSIQQFYLQAEQVNRGLDNVDDFVRGKVNENMQAHITLDDELARLRLKCEEMRAARAGNPKGDFYVHTETALHNIFKAWKKLQARQ